VNIRYVLCGLLAITLSFAVCGQQCTPVLSGLVGWWAGDGNGDDISGSGNNGTATAVTYSVGKVDRAFQMNGATSGVVIPQSSSLAVTNLTFTAWINPSDTYAQPIVEYDNENDTVGVHFWINTDGYRNAPLMLYANVRQGIGLEHLLVGANVIRLNNWNFVAVTYDHNSGIGRLYANGQLVQEQNLGSYQPLTAKTFHIGNRPIGNLDGGGFAGAHFSGGIDEVQVCNRALSQGELAAIYSAGAAGVCKQLIEPHGTNGLLAYYPLDGSAIDTGPLHLDAPVTRASPTTDRFGAPNGALHFNGVSDFVSLGNRPEFNFPSNFTLSAWIKPDGVQTDKYVLGKYFSTGPFSNESHSYGIGLNEVSGSYGFVLGDGVIYTDLRNGPPLNDGKWHSIALTYDQASGVSLYTDGTLTESAPAPHLGAFTNASSLMIGRIESGQNFGGSVDDVMIFSRALSADEVQALYTAQTGAPELGISRAVKLEFITTPGKKYQLEMTRDLVHWTAYRDPLTATGVTTAIYVDVPSFPDETFLANFLRVRLIP
jgi:hypothetical protein